MQGSRLRYGMLTIALYLIAGTASVAVAATADAPRITKEEAKALLGHPAVVFVDARISSAWNKSSQKIPGAVRPDKWDLESWAAAYDQNTTFIVY
jgi:hypothetical protein